MSYLVLARKWRPDTFDAMVGQEHVLQALINSLTQQRLHHAYLFTGSRGVGKTTVARLLAKAFNCEQGISAKPCGTCQTCQDIATGRCVDFIEIDAASRTKVEDTREILDNVQYAPSHCRFKVYLIDEVHMLSGHSFNALLKTMEEPPSHVKFLLATTDPQKLPVTVLSRCLQFNLKNMLPEQISSHLSKILDQEHLNYEPPALELIAKAASGSMRDALSVLDQAIAYSDKMITTATTRSMLGYIEHGHILRLMHALAQHDASGLLSINRELLQQGADFSRVLADLLDILHQLTILQMVPECEFIQCTDRHSLQSLAAHFTPQDIQLCYQIALKGQSDLALSPSPLVGFDMIMLRMLAFKPLAPTLQAPTPATNIRTTPTQQQPMVAPPALVTPPTTPSAPALDWGKIIPQLKLTGIAQNIIQHCMLLNYDQDQLTLALEPGHQSILTLPIRQRIEDAFNLYFNRKMKLNIEVSSGQLESPARKQHAQTQQRLASAQQTLGNDTNLNKILTAFDGKIIENSLELNE